MKCKVCGLTIISSNNRRLRKGYKCRKMTLLKKKVYDEYFLCEDCYKSRNRNSKSKKYGYDKILERL